MTWHIFTPAFQHAGQESCHVLLHLRALWRILSHTAHAGGCERGVEAHTAAARLHEGNGM